MNLNSQTVGSKPHDTGRFHPRNLLQLLLALIQRHEEDVSANVTAIPRTAQVRRAAVFLGNEPRRTETRFCPRRNGDSSSASKSSSRASSSSSRTGSSGCRYDSSCEMVGVFLAINPGQWSSGNRERNHYNCFSRIEIEKFTGSFAQAGSSSAAQHRRHVPDYWRSSTSQSPSSGEDNAVVT